MKKSRDLGNKRRYERAQYGIKDGYEINKIYQNGVIADDLEWQ